MATSTNSSRPIVLAIGLDDWTFDDLQRAFGKRARLVACAELDDARRLARRMEPTIVVVGEEAGPLPMWVVVHQLRELFVSAPVLVLGDLNARTRRQTIVAGALWVGSATREVGRALKFVGTFLGREQDRRAAERATAAA